MARPWYNDQYFKIFIDKYLHICIDKYINICFDTDIDINIDIDSINTDASTVNSVHACLWYIARTKR